MVRYQLARITIRDGRNNPHQHISHLGVTTAGGMVRSTEDNVIHRSETGRDSMYLVRMGHTVEVAVAERHGRRHLNAEIDDGDLNSLLDWSKC